MTSIKCWIFSILALIIGLGVGFYASAYFTSYFYIDANYKSVLNDTDSNLVALNDLRDGDTDKAINTLERRASVNILFLNAGNESERLSDGTRQAISRVLKSASEYSEKYSLTSGHDETDEMVRDVLKRNQIE